MEGISPAWYAYALMQIRGLGPRTYAVLQEALGDPETIWHAPVELLCNIISPKIAASIARERMFFSFSAAAAEMQAHGIKLIWLKEASYPRLLLEIPAPPPVLLYRGDITAASASIPVAVVGTRSPTPYGAEATKRIADDLAASGATLISGMALGVDAIVHTAAIERGLPTVAVLGSGLSDPVLYPRANLRLAQKIVAAGGVLISMLPPATEARPEFFPQRNHIIAGIAVATVLTEGRLPSGGIITAYAALEYNRDVFAVPGPITSTLSDGPHALLKKGAQVATVAADILGERAAAAPSAQQAAPKTMGHPLQQRIYASLCAMAKQTDELARELDLPAAELLYHLQEMELADSVRNIGGQRFVAT